MDDSWMFHRGRTIDFPIPEGVTGPIYTLGDSHVNILVETMPSMFLSTRQASISAWSLPTIERQAYLIDALSFVPEGAKLLCYFGEIDCRHYVPKHAKEQKRTIKSLVSEIVTRYTDNFLTLLQRKYRLIVLGPYITPDDHKHWCIMGNEGWSNDFDQIVKAKRLFDKQLKLFCESAGIAFVPIHRVAREKKWDLSPTGTYFADESHLGPCMIPIILDTIKGYQWRGFDV